MIGIISKSALDSSIYSKDGRFQLLFKPMRIIMLTDDDVGDPIGLFLLERDKDDPNRYSRICHVPCERQNWHNSECHMLAKIDKLDYPEQDRREMKNFVMQELASQTREQFEKGSYVMDYGKCEGDMEIDLSNLKFINPPEKENEQ